MLRISATDRLDSGTRLRLEGALMGPWVDELDSACARAAEAGGRVELDLSQVGFIDRDGVALLRRLMDRGAIVLSCSHFVCAQLQA
jgi:ABC-type transporter Mla MlaB component